MSKHDHYLKQELYQRFCKTTEIFDFLQEATLDGLWYWDIEQGEHEWLSERFWTTLGYDPSTKEHLASAWKDIIHPEDLRAVKRNFEKHLADPNHPFDQVVRYTHQDGSTVWVRCRGFALKDETGKTTRMLGAHNNVTQLMRAHHEMVELKQEYETVFHGSQDALFLVKVMGFKHFCFVRSNQAHQQKTGIPLTLLAGKTPYELLGPSLGESVSLNYQRCVEAKEAITYEEKLELPAGKRVWSTTLTPIVDGDQITHIVGSAIDVTAQKELEEKLEYLARHDTLTGLPNRMFLAEYLDQYTRARDPFSLMVLDLNGFKKINDSYGHLAGDEVLKIVAKRLQSKNKEHDMVCRIGGDEFIILKHRASHQQHLDDCLQQLRTLIEQPVSYHDQTLSVSAAIGYAQYPEDGTDYDSLMRSADARMYQQKNHRSKLA